MRGHNYSRANHDELAPAMELIYSPDPWYTDPKELAVLWRWLDEQGRTPDDPAYFMERAEKWRGEHAEMIAEEREEERRRLYEEERAMNDQRYAP